MIQREFDDLLNDLYINCGSVDSSIYTDQLEEEIDEIKKKISLEFQKIMTENFLMRNALLSIEWWKDDNENERYCLICGNYERSGHYSSCIHRKL